MFTSSLARLTIQTACLELVQDVLLEQARLLIFDIISGVQPDAGLIVIMGFQLGNWVLLDVCLGVSGTLGGKY